MLLIIFYQAIAFYFHYKNFQLSRQIYPITILWIRKYVLYLIEITNAPYFSTPSMGHGSRASGQSRLNRDGLIKTDRQ